MDVSISSHEAHKGSAGAATDYSLTFGLAKLTVKNHAVRPCDYAIEIEQQRDAFSLPLFFQKHYSNSLTTILGEDYRQNSIESISRIKATEVCR